MCISLKKMYKVSFHLRDLVRKMPSEFLLMFKVPSLKLHLVHLALVFLQGNQRVVLFGGEADLDGAELGGALLVLALKDAVRNDEL